MSQYEKEVFDDLCNSFQCDYETIDAILNCCEWVETYND